MKKTDESIYIDSEFGAMLLAQEKENLEKRRAIVEEIKELANTATNWKEANKKFYELCEEFKEIYCSDAEELSIINRELSEAKHLFYDKRNAFFEKSQENFKENANKKKEILSKLEETSYINNNYKEVDEHIKDLTKEFFNIGFAGKEENDTIFDKFNELRNKLREERKSIFKELEGEFESKRNKKKEIIKALEALVNNENWKEATVKFNELCDEFKSIGFSGKEENDEISEAYANAKNAFFNERQKFFDEVKASNEVNIIKRKELIEKLKTLYVNESWKEASKEVKALSDEFFKVGFCGKDVNESLINEFKEARDKFYALRQEYFDQVNSSRNEKQLEFLNSLVKNKEEFIAKLRGFVKKDEERLEDFKGRLFNVRPGEKAEDIIENYQNIIEDIKSRISNNKTKIKTVQDELFEVNKQIKEIKEK
ncbi:DUF349 domain-containing protein [Clostridium massiliamazoniense]|uniref:DUF349 domain-containing protein n=1 Tax=Clostridium massiliamazoniense TaxID=1347366 RepID=UPI0006D8066E|nr:DUF349 domain-containing protein [Clostridium massiliamazoniense]